MLKHVSLTWQPPPPDSGHKDVMTYFLDMVMWCVALDVYKFAFTFTCFHVEWPVASVPALRHLA